MEPGIQIGFDCGAHATLNRKTENLSLAVLKCEHFTGNNLRTAVGRIVVPNGHLGLAINYRGTLIVRNVEPGRIFLAPPRSIVALRPLQGTINAARGDHQLTLISWPVSATPLLDLWLSRFKPDDFRSRAIAGKPFAPSMLDLVSRVEAALARADETSELLLLGACYEAVTTLMAGNDLMELSSTPPDLPPSIQDLIDTVRQSPSSSWPLRDAAARAGYSPFHFSRVFKSLVGFGFHEYVDRCRTELAVKMLATSDRPVESVAQAAGFGTTQGLRESIKEYLGLVPSELRSGPVAREES